MIIDANGNREMTFIHGPNINSIDYTLKVDGFYSVGSSVICSFRTQIFTTRSHVALIDPQIEDCIIGMFDAHGHAL